MAVPERLGKYEIRRILGAGAAGTVYEAWDPDIRRLVAIKTVRLPDAADSEAAEMGARFQREAEAAGRLTHPNVVAIYDYGADVGVAYIVMELVPGESLKSRLARRQPIPQADITRIMQDLLAGLQFSHDRGVVHRDIKPANVMLTGDGRAKIADFGIARIDGSSMTVTGTVMGTLAYMSPEQINGERVDARSDIYSAGVVLYQLLTGERPFEGGEASIMQKILKTAPILPSDIRVTSPIAFDSVVSKALAKRPEDRFASAASFAVAVRDAEVGRGLPGEADVSPTVVALRRPAVVKPEVPPAAAAKSRTPVVVGAIVVMALLVGVGVGFLLREPAGSVTAVAPAPVALVAEAPKPPRGPPRQLRDCQTCPEMVLIPAGHFIMGGAQNFSFEKPQHDVAIQENFYLGKFPVTVGEYQAFATANPSYDAGIGWKNAGFAQTDRHPVVDVSYDDAMAYIAWLRRLTGKGYALPSEAQWEYAARGGTQTAYYWDSDFRDGAGYTPPRSKGTVPVGTLKQYGFGLYDVLGHVWQWTADPWHGDYSGAPSEGSAWLVNGNNGERVVRGGSWYDPPLAVRAGMRAGIRIDQRSNQGGFRLSRTL